MLWRGIYIAGPWHLHLLPNYRLSINKNRNFFFISTRTSLWHLPRWLIAPSRHGSNICRDVPLLLRCTAMHDLRESRNSTIYSPYLDLHFSPLVRLMRWDVLTLLPLWDAWLVKGHPRCRITSNHLQTHRSWFILKWATWRFPTISS